MTYYQMKRVLRKLKSIQNQIKYTEYPHYPEPVICSALKSMDKLIIAVLSEQHTVGRGVPLPKGF